MRDCMDRRPAVNALTTDCEDKEMQTSITAIPNHTRLPDSDGRFVESFHELLQSILLTDSLWPVLEAARPDHQFTIGQRMGIYWRLAKPPEPLERGAVSPDWFLICGVPPALDGKPRRSYVLWNDYMKPFMILEFVSGDGSEERDRTPWKGKFWIYEKVLRPGYYGIYEIDRAQMEMYFVSESRLQRMEANGAGRFPIEEFGVELGIWHGKYRNLDLPWMRWWSSEGDLIPTGHERAEQERERAERLAAKLRSLGLDPDTMPES